MRRRGVVAWLSLTRVCCGLVVDVMDYFISLIGSALEVFGRFGLIRWIVVDSSRGTVRKNPFGGSRFDRAGSHRPAIGWCYSEVVIRSSAYCTAASKASWGLCWPITAWANCSCR